MSAPKERPILFSGEMVKALLDGSKSQTRRIIKPQPVLSAEHEKIVSAAWADGWIDVKCPYGHEGDRLWLRETWRFADWTEDGYPWIEYRADGAKVFHEGNVPEDWGEKLTDIWTRLSLPSNYNIDGKAADRRWRPAIHMPRWASRLTLEITEVRVQRLNEITEADAVAEGFADTDSALPELDGPIGGGFRIAGAHQSISAVGNFALTWEALNAKRGFDWDSNPFVWALSFRRLSV